MKLSQLTRVIDENEIRSLLAQEIDRTGDDCLPANKCICGDT